MGWLRCPKSAKLTKLQGAIMAFLSKFGKSTGLVSQTRANKLDAATVMASPKGAITPDNPGDWTVMSVPIPAKAQQFNHQEASALVGGASKMKAQKESTKVGYKAIRDMSRAATEANLDHNVTKRVVAAGTMQSLAANAETATLLNQLRPVYAKVQTKLQYAFAEAEGQIAAIG